MKFNKDISFAIFIAPNGWEVTDKRVMLGLAPNTSKSIESFIISWTWNCVETESSIKTMLKSDRFCSTSNGRYAVISMGSAPQKEDHQLTFEFIINSLVLKYKQSAAMVYYPSMRSLRLKEKTKFTWTASKSLIERFKEYSHGQSYNAPLFDDMCIICFPNGFNDKLHGQFVPAIKLLSFPVKADVIRVTVSVKSNFG